LTELNNTHIIYNVKNLKNKNKKMKKILILLIALVLLGNVYAGYNIEFNGLADAFQNKLVWVHFQWWWNNFWGMFFVTDLKNLSTPEDIIVSPSKKITNCKKQVKWYYFNSLHWEVLYPLDNDTKSLWSSVNPSYYSGLEIIWWLYTECDGDENGVYWQIVYKKANKKLFILTAGFKYNANSNKIKWDFAKNLQIVKWKLLWLLHDSSYGIWFVWWEVEWDFEWLVNMLNNKSIEEVVWNVDNKDNIKLTDWTKTIYVKPEYWISVVSNMLALWLLNIWANGKNITRGVLWNFMKNLISKKTVVTNAKVINVSNVLNMARKNAEKLCEWRWKLKGWTVNINIPIDSKYQCIKWDNLTINVNDDLTLNNDSVYIIVKWKKNKVIFKENQSDKWYVNVFVDNWMVLFDSWIYLESMWYTSWAVFKWNIIVNGIIWWTDNTNELKVFPHKLYIYGSLASLNKIEENEKVKETLEKMLGINNIVDKYIITRVFGWRCLDIWKWSDGVDCSNPKEKYNFYSLITIKKNYKNLLINN